MNARVNIYTYIQSFVVVFPAFTFISHLAKFCFKFTNGLDILERTAILELWAAFSKPFQARQVVGTETTILENWTFSLDGVHVDKISGLK